VFSAKHAKQILNNALTFTKGIFLPETFFFLAAIFLIKYWIYFPAKTLNSLIALKDLPLVN